MLLYIMRNVSVWVALFVFLDFIITCIHIHKLSLVTEYLDNDRHFIE